MDRTRGREELVGQITAEDWMPGRRVGLPSWRLTTASREVAERVSELYRGEAVRAASGRDLHVRKLRTEGMTVTVANVAQARPRLVLENERGLLLHACDGSTFLAPMPDEGKPCGCPEDPFERKAASRSGAGPRPDARLVLRLTGAPELGELSFQSSAWQFYESLEVISRGVERISGPLQMELVLRERRLTTRSGLDVSFTYPEVHSLRRLSVTKVGLHLAA